MKTRAWGLAALVGVAMAVGTRPCAAADPPYLQAYNTIKALESQFPLPQAQADLNVGTFDAASGQFSGLTSSTEIIQDPVLHKPVRITLPAIAPVNAVGVRLKFAAAN